MRLTKDFGESRMREIRTSGSTRGRESGGHWRHASHPVLSLSTLLRERQFEQEIAERTEKNSRIQQKLTKGTKRIQKAQKALFFVIFGPFCQKSLLFVLFAPVLRLAPRRFLPIQPRTFT
jgi:hypothetical protein